MSSWKEVEVRLRARNGVNVIVTAVIFRLVVRVWVQEECFGVRLWFVRNLGGAFSNTGIDALCREIGHTSPERQPE